MNDAKGYVVEYKDDFNVKHITYVQNFSGIRFLQDRFDRRNVTFEPVVRNEHNNQYFSYFCS